MRARRGLALVAAAYALLRLAGEPLFPLLYLVVAFAATFQPRAAAAAVLGACFGLEALAAARVGSLFPAVWHVVFLATAGALAQVRASQSGTAVRVEAVVDGRG